MFYIRAGVVLRVLILLVGVFAGYEEENRPDSLQRSSAFEAGSWKTRNWSRWIIPRFPLLHLLPAQFTCMIILMYTWYGCMPWTVEYFLLFPHHECETTLVDAGKGEIISEHYSLLPCDLRVSKNLDDAFAKAGLDAKWELAWVFPRFLT